MPHGNPLRRILHDYGWPVAFRLAKANRLVCGRIGELRAVGVTGSCGKTAATAMIAAITESQGRTLYRWQLLNGTVPVARALFDLRPWHRYAVQELATHGPGTLRRSAGLFRPHVGVVTSVGGDHYTAFRGLEATAAEKSSAVEALPADGAAVLNADDPLVWAMRDKTKAKVISFGVESDADVRGSDLRGDWPERFSLIVRYGSEQVQVSTQLLGIHWAPSVLGAMAAAVALGIPLETAATAIGQVEPVEGRLSVAETPGGVTFIRDDWKAPFWTVAPALEFLRSAHARRKIAVIGTLSDYPGSSAPRYRNAARMALDAVDFVVFVGKMAATATKRPVEGAEGRVLGCDTLFELDRHFRGFLEPGDLVLLKGSNAADHLERLALSRSSEIACWHPRCGLWKPCQECRRQMSPYVPENLVT